MRTYGVRINSLVKRIISVRRSRFKFNEIYLNDRKYTSALKNINYVNFAGCCLKPVAESNRNCV